MNAVPSSIERDHFVWALGAMCRMHKVPFDADQAMRQFLPPYRFDHLSEAARSLGFEAKLTRLSGSRLQATQTPCIVALKPGPDGANGGKRPDCADVGMVVRAGADELDLLHAPGGAEGRLTRDAFVECFSGDALQFRPAPGPVARADDAESGKFGFAWFVPELLKHRALWRDVLLASLAIQVIALVTPLLTQVVIDRVVAHQTVNTLVAIAMALALLVAFTATMSWARQYLILHTGNRIDAALANRVFEHLLALPARYFETRPTGTLTARLHGIETIREFLTGAAVTVVLDLPFLLVFLAAMLYYSVELTLVVVALLAVMVALSLAIAPLIRRSLDRQFMLGARNQAFLTEFVAGIETVKSLQMEPQLRRRYSEYLSGLLTAGFRTRQLHNGYNVAVQSLEQVVALAVLCLGALEVMRNEGFTVGMLVAFQMFSSRLAQPLSRFAGLWQEFQQAGIAVKRLGDLMDAPGEPVSAVPQHAPSAETHIELDNVWFRHSERSAELFRGLSYEILDGQCVAITGASGSGKSTLARLLQGLYAPTEGRIRINGHDIRSLPVNELRSLLGVVPQDTVLFSGTVYENLLLGNPHAGFEEVVHACRLAEIHETIEALPEGYQTWLGEHGTGLSGGQKQRIAVARALLKRPRVLLFDEATSQLDAPTADALFATINRLRRRLTIIVVAHEAPRSLQLDGCIALGG
jgi:subfamily B ATP-binding cassette protein HlyB/CyaB